MVYNGFGWDDSTHLHVLATFLWQTSLVMFLWQKTKTKTKITPPPDRENAERHKYFLKFLHVSSLLTFYWLSHMTKPRFKRRSRLYYYVEKTAEFQAKGNGYRRRWRIDAIYSIYHSIKANSRRTKQIIWSTKIWWWNKRKRMDRKWEEVEVRVILKMLFNNQ